MGSPYKSQGPIPENAYHNPGIPTTKHHCQCGSIEQGNHYSGAPSRPSNHQLHYGGALPLGMSLYARSLLQSVRRLLLAAFNVHFITFNLTNLKWKLNFLAFTFLDIRISWWCSCRRRRKTTTRPGPRWLNQKLEYWFKILNIAITLNWRMLTRNEWHLPELSQTIFRSWTASTGHSTHCGL